MNVIKALTVAATTVVVTGVGYLGYKSYKSSKEYQQRERERREQMVATAREGREEMLRQQAEHEAYMAAMEREREEMDIKHREVMSMIEEAHAKEIELAAKLERGEITLHAYVEGTLGSYGPIVLSQKHSTS